MLSNCVEIGGLAELLVVFFPEVWLAQFPISSKLDV